ncbi:PREDICTED: uncharacterized protein LOC109580989 [Amphimedon queenslandica]|uniref:Uncharacterized protein n=1 Tax=Amphimedon queenslandica TaxID=400682 RepID=A0AAN0J0J0_AMPQE|nr:PREDICTED: uncharacterized protein LOC109580989 [Amphimedon queenslandica]|eukprot:XP_019850228.1 PREDICTED: uncharacterized protein LOC109580989 [Amphimedon queenslandica]
MNLSISLSLTILFFVGASGVDIDGLHDATGFNEIEALVQGWRQLSDEERLDFKEFIDSVTGRRSKSSNNSGVTVGHKHDKYKIYQSLDLYSYYSYLYYYPTIHWSLCNTPDTKDYWVGIYKVGASDRQYLTHKWIGMNAQGSYYIGQLLNESNTGEKSKIRFEEFELRLFKGGYKRVSAISNKLYGVVRSSPFTKASDQSRNEHEIDPKIKSFIPSLEKALDSNAKSTLTKENLQNLWFQFSEQERDLLYPILEQDCLPIHIRKPEYTDDEEWPEPLKAYPDLPKSVPTAAEDKSSVCSNKLWISLRHSYTYVYPVLDTKKTLSGKYAWLGVYRKRYTLPYPSAGYLTWQWVGPGQRKVSYLCDIMDHNQGPISQVYVGPVFNHIGSAYTQVGFGSGSIYTAINVTPQRP